MKSRCGVLLLLLCLFCQRAQREPMPGVAIKESPSPHADGGKSEHKADGIAVYDAPTTTFLMRDTPTTGFADHVVTFGQKGDLPLVGDWDGDGIDTVGVFRPSNATFYLRYHNTSGNAEIVVAFGSPGDIPLSGDWDGDGKDSIGVYRPKNSTFYLRNSLTSGNADLVIPFGKKGDLPVVGNWDGKGIDRVGVYRRADSSFHLLRAVKGGDEITLTVKVRHTSTALPLAGDWNGEGVDTVAIWRDGVFLLKNTNTSGPPDAIVTYGLKTHRPLAGRWR